MQRLNPSLSPAARDTVQAIATELKKQNAAAAEQMSKRFSQLYGDLSGQRAVSAKVIQAYAGINTLTPHDLVLGLETFFAIVCRIISASALTSDRKVFLKDLIALPGAQFTDRMALIMDGRFHEAEGHRIFASTLEKNLIDEASLENLTAQLRILSQLIFAEAEDGAFDTFDPLQSLHNAVFPSNLSHVTGQFYTPPWLAQMVLKSTDWKPGKKLVDPFCGSGVFLLAALKEAIEQGFPIAEAAESLLGIDLSPSAVCAARTNLLLFYVRNAGKLASELPINILCADSLAPTITKGQQLGQGLFASKAFFLNGKSVSEADAPTTQTVALCLSDIGLDLSRWGIPHSDRSSDRLWSEDDKQLAEQIAAYEIAPSDVVVTNPPWVGWEYISRRYREQITPAWSVYDLFEQKGLKAAFLKEDLSTLCVPAALDTYLADGGCAGLVLRQSTMKSDLAGKGVRRLSIYKKQDPLKLTRIHDLGKLNVFEGAAAPAAVWIVKKGEQTKFPVPVSSWGGSTARSIGVRSELSKVLASVEITEEFCRPVSDADPNGRWAFDSSSATADPLAAMKGSNTYKPRIGFFTGGANAVYYLNGKKSANSSSSVFRNITERAKREAPAVSVKVENDLVYSVIRGRDVSYWSTNSEVYVLCPHNEETKIKPIEFEEMKNSYPNSFRYLSEMKYLLDQRKGFAGWEKNTQIEYFYAIQRIGEYSFSEYKVCWSYISEDFVVAVCSSDSDGKPMLPNDKVVFIPAKTREEAFFIAGILSFNVVRSSVISSVTGRQISANVIKPYALPQFDRDDEIHMQISTLCEAGHMAVFQADFTSAEIVYDDLNLSCQRLFGVSSELVEDAKRVIKNKLGYYPFKIGRKVRATMLDRSSD